MNTQLSAREIAIARKVEWAEKNGLHAEAIEYARKYINLDQHMLKLISEFYEINDLVDLQAQHKAKNEVFAKVISYIRTQRFTPEE